MSSLPEEIVVSDLDPYRSDWWAMALMRERAGDPFPAPAAAARPRSTEEVVACVRWAREQGLGVVVRGGGSGVCGSAVPAQGCLVIDMAEIAHIEVDPMSFTFMAGAGIFGPALEQRLEEHGMTLGHVPQSFNISTLGGWIATKATGQLSTLYGGIEDRLLGLTAVLASGEVVSNRAVPRVSAGPDWWRLFLGAEGTLGVVTEATVSAFATPETHIWVQYSLKDFESGLELCRRCIAKGIRPSVARVYDAPDAALNFGPLGITDPVAIFRFEGSSEIVEASAASMARTGAGLGDVIDVDAGRHWWEHRFKAADTYRQILAGNGALGRFGVVDTIEVAATWSQLGSLYRGVVDAMTPHVDVLLAHASHLYPSGANIYFTFLIASASDDREAMERYGRAWEAGAAATHGASATLSHHHGIGLQKAPWLAGEWGSGASVQSMLKKAFDPSGLMNPGKL